MITLSRKFELDPEKVLDEVCSCCGTPCKTVIGFVHEASATRAGYVIRLVIDNPNHDILIALGIGAWGKETSKNTRVLICAKIKFNKNGKRCYEFIHPDNSPWKYDEILGIKVPPEYVKGENKTEAILLADFILDSDKRIYDLFPSH